MGSNLSSDNFSKKWNIGQEEKERKGKKDLLVIVDDLLERADNLMSIIKGEIELIAKAGASARDIRVLLKVVRGKLQDDFSNWVYTGLRTRDGDSIFYSTREGFAEEVNFSYLVGIEPVQAKGKI